MSLSLFLLEPRGRRQNIRLDISNLNNVENLERLVLTNVNISHLSVIGDLTELKELYFDQVPIHNISYLKNLKKLEMLKVENTKVSDFSPLKELRGLEVLILQGNRRLSDVEDLKNFDNLRFIDIRGTNISEEDYADLEDSLPNTTIQYEEKYKVEEGYSKKIDRRLRDWGYLR